MRIEVTNALSRVIGDAAELKALDEATSYPIDGAHFHPAYRAHQWDGREHLLRKARGKDYHMCPTGVLVDLDEELNSPIEFIDRRRRPTDRLELTWIGPPLREYQLRAIDKALEDRGVFTGLGMWNLPIRSGKTKTAAGMIQRTGLRTLFVVPSEMLLSQTAENLRECIEDAPIGIYGGGSHEADEWITIATAQSLLAKPAVAARLLSTCDLLFIDEAHHLEGEAWRSMLMRADAYYKIGLSATIFVSRVKQNNKASIWLKACTGPIIDRVSMNYLFQRGHLLPPQILFYRFQHGTPDQRDKDWQWVARERLAQNRLRNGMIVDLAQAAIGRKLRVLIDTGRKDQLKMIMGFARARGITAEFIDGETPSEMRKAIIKRFRAGETEMLAGTVFGEGVDIPELEVVINAEGQKTPTAAIQRMRNLTPSDGKTSVMFIDIADLNHKILGKHAIERLNLYRGLRGVKVKAIERGSKHDPLQA